MNTAEREPPVERLAEQRVHEVAGELEGERGLDCRHRLEHLTHALHERCTAQHSSSARAPNE